MTPEEIIRQTSKSFAVTWGTMAPFQLGGVRVGRIGFADIPVVTCTVYAADTSSIVPTVRAYVYKELETMGLPSDGVELAPTVQRGRRRKFVDRNESSPTLGKNKMGYELRFTFEIKREFVSVFNPKDRL